MTLSQQVHGLHHAPSVTTADNDIGSHEPDGRFAMLFDGSAGVGLDTELALALQTQPALSRRQAHGGEHLQRFYSYWLHREGRQNAADPSSHSPDSPQAGEYPHCGHANKSTAKRCFFIIFDSIWTC